jgi:hypothetical protein
VVKRLIILKNILDGYVGRKTGEDVKKTINIARLNNKQLYRALSLFDRKMIRKFAKTINIPVGDNKEPKSVLFEKDGLNGRKFYFAYISDDTKTHIIFDNVIKYIAGYI